MSEPRRFPVMRIVKSVVSIVLLTAIGWSIARTEGIDELPERVSSIEPLAVIVASALQFGSVLVGVLRWRMLLRWQSIDRPYAELLRVYLVGRFVGAFTPGTTGLDVTRAIAIGRSTGELAKSTTVIAVEKVFGLLGLALAAIATLPLGASRFFGPSAHSFVALAAVGSLALLFLVLRPRLLARVGAPLPRALRAKIDAIADRLDATPPRPTELVSMVGLATVSHLFTAACYAASGIALDVPASLGELWVVGFAIVAATLVPISAGGAGVREGTAVVLLHAIGVPTSEAVLVALLGYLATQPPAIVGGFVQLATRAPNETSNA